jgi:GH15 family glucan-1,4-alpha-glucosidase
MSSGAYPPISDYGLIGDCHGAALVSRDGSIDWCCFHRFDARPVFARVLDWSKGGHYRIAPTDDYTVSRRYVEDTNIIETTFTAGAGQALLIDCMPIARQGHPHHELVRVVRGNSGEIELALEFEPRFDYGLSVPKLKLASESGGIVYGGADALRFHAPVALEQTGKGSCYATFTVREGDELTFCLGYYLAHEADFEELDQRKLESRFQDTLSFWRKWAAHCH